MDGLSKRRAKKGKRTTRGWPAARFVKIVARVTAATSFAGFSTVTEAAQWSPGRSAVLGLSLEEFVARANSFLNRSKMAPLSLPRPLPRATGSSRARFGGRAAKATCTSLSWRTRSCGRSVRSACHGARPMRRRCFKATLIAAVSAKLSAKERREIAAALLKFSRSDSEKSYSLEIAGVRHSCTLMLPACHAVSARAPKQ